MKTNRLTISVRRHADPKKDPDTGKSLDELSDAGVAQAHDIGTNIGTKLVIPAGKILGYHSPKNRAYQTLVEMMKGTGAPYQNLGESPLLDTLGITPESMIAYLVDSDGNKRAYDDIVNLMLEDKYSVEGDETFANSGERIVQKLKQDFNYVLLNATSDETLVENISHGPVVDAGYIAALDKPIISTHQFGGAFQPGENFLVIVEYQTEGIGCQIKSAKLQLREEKPESNQELEMELTRYALQHHVQL